jgi:hypothetical protein
MEKIRLRIRFGNNIKFSDNHKALPFSVCVNKGEPIFFFLVSEFRNIFLPIFKINGENADPNIKAIDSDGYDILIDSKKEEE